MYPFWRIVLTKARSHITIATLRTVPSPPKFLHVLPLVKPSPPKTPLNPDNHKSSLQFCLFQNII